MACEIYYFETDSYGVSLYEEEVTTEPQEGTTAVNNVAEAVGVEDLLNPVGDNKCEKKNGVARTPHGSGPREPWESVLPCPSKSYRKQYSFTRGQLRKLNRAFEKTHHPNDLQRCVWDFLNSFLVFQGLGHISSLLASPLF